MISDLLTALTDEMPHRPKARNFSRENFIFVSWVLIICLYFVISEFGKGIAVPVKFKNNVEKFHRID